MVGRGGRRAVIGEQADLTYAYEHLGNGFETLADLGAEEVCLGDTIGVGVPAQVHDLTRRVVDAGLPLDRLAYHFHDTRGTALANVMAAAGHPVTLWTFDCGEPCTDARNHLVHERHPQAALAAVAAVFVFDLNGED